MAQIGLPEPSAVRVLALFLSGLGQLFVLWVLSRVARWTWPKIAARVRYDRPEDEPRR